MECRKAPSDQRECPVIGGFSFAKDIATRDHTSVIQPAYFAVQV